MHEWKVMCLNPTVGLFSILIFFSFPLFPSHHFRFFSPAFLFFLSSFPFFPFKLALPLQCSSISLVVVGMIVSVTQGIWSVHVVEKLLVFLV